MKRSSGSGSEVLLTSPGDRGQRDLIYSVLSLITFPVVCYLSLSWLSSFDLFLDHISQNRELPWSVIIFSLACEGFKLCVAIAMTPTAQLINPLSTAWVSSGGAGGGKLYNPKLPVSRKDKEFSNGKGGQPFQRIVEIFKLGWNFLLACAVCHVFIVLFGAAVIENFTLTLQLSMLVTCWTFFPLCLVIRPDRILVDLAYLSIWNCQVEVISRAKWRFLLSLAGTMVGAVFIPLDWDRPWQKWPVPCLLSSAFSYNFINLLIAIYLFSNSYCSNFKLWNPFKNPSKVKNF